MALKIDYMIKIQVSDITMKLADSEVGSPLSFRQKIELGKMLDRLGVSVVEMGPIREGRSDSLLIKSLAQSLKDSVLAVPVDVLDAGSVERTWSAVQGARHPRLQVCAPVSTVQMEYLCHRKPEAIRSLVADTVARCAALGAEVEFVAEDYGRSDREFLVGVIGAAVESGAGIVTIHDTAGTLFDYECFDSTKWIRTLLPEHVRLGVCCSNDLFMADTCAVAAVRAGADEVKTTPYGNTTTSLKRFVHILHAKSDVCKACCDVRVTELQRAVNQIKALCEADRKKMTASAAGGGAKDDGELMLTLHDDREAVLKVASCLGYDLSEEDGQRVYEAFLSSASRNGKVEAKELEALIASVAFQAPPTYRLESYLVNSGNLIAAVCHLRLRRKDELIESVCVGDGPVDAAFRCIEKLIGAGYELDDFQLQSVTEGREAMGGAVVRLRHNGKIFSGRGVSRDIVGSSIMAYLNAVNKIVNEEEED